MDEQQDKNSEKSQNDNLQIAGNSLPQNKVVSDIVPEGEKSVVAQQSEHINKPAQESPATEMKNDYSVLTAAPVNSKNDGDNAGSVLLGMGEPRNFKPLYLLAAVALFVVVGFAAAYFGGFMPPFFGRLTNEQVIEKMFDAIPSIRSGRYAMELNFKSEARLPGAQGYDLSAILNASGGETSGSKVRDAKRLNAIVSIRQELDNYKKNNGRYPQFLNDIKLNPDLLMDPLAKNQYGYRQEKGGMDFTLHVQMETDRGINDYRNAVLVIPSASLRTVEDRLAVVHADTPKLKVQPSAGVTDIAVTAYDPTRVLQNLPSEIDATLRFSGLAQLDAEVADAQFSADGNLILSGMSFSAGVELLKKGDTVYGKIKEAPSLGLFDLAAIKNKWVKMNEADLGRVGLDTADDAMRKEYQQKFLGLAKAYLKILKEEKILEVAKELPKTKEKDGTYYHYQVNINNEKTARIYERFNEEVKKQFGTADDFVSSDLIAYLRGPEALKAGEISQQNTMTEIWINTKTFLPHRFTSDSVFVPPDNIEKLREKQYRARVTFDLSEINKPVVIEAPGDAISVNDAEKLVVGN